MKIHNKCWQFWVLLTGDDGNMTILWVVCMSPWLEQTETL